MYSVSIELQKHDWKFVRTRNAVGIQAAGECFHSFFEFSQTFTSVSMENMYLNFLENTVTKKGKQLVYFDHQNVNSLCSRHHYINSAR